MIPDSEDNSSVGSGLKIYFCPNILAANIVLLENIGRPGVRMSDKKSIRHWLKMKAWEQHWIAMTNKATCNNTAQQQVWGMLWATKRNISPEM